VTIADVNLTGRMNFDCGKFEYGTLFEAAVLGAGGCRAARRYRMTILSRHHLSVTLSCDCT
jgi:hypothetical protein